MKRRTVQAVLLAGALAALAAFWARKVRAGQGGPHAPEMGCQRGWYMDDQGRITIAICGG